MATEDWLTVADIAKRLQVDAETVRRWIRADELKALRLGGKGGFRISTSELDAFIRRKQNRTANRAP